MGSLFQYTGQIALVNRPHRSGGASLLREESPDVIESPGDRSKWHNRRRARGVTANAARPLDAEVLVAVAHGQSAPTVPPGRMGFEPRVRECRDAAEIHDRLVAADQNADAILLWFPDAVWPSGEIRRLLVGALPPVFLALPSRPAGRGWSGEATLLIHDGTLADAYGQMLAQLGRTSGGRGAEEPAADGGEIPISVMRIPEEGRGARQDYAAGEDEIAARLQASKFATLQESAAGLAHEMNNLVTPIAGYAQLLRSYTSDETVGRKLDIIANSAFRASELIAELLTFTKSPVLALETVRAAEWLAEAVADLAPRVEECGVHLVSRAPLDLPSVEIDPERMRKALEHIVWNGVQAMEEAGREGTIQIEASVAEQLSDEDYRRFGLEALDAIEESDASLQVGDPVLRIDVRDEGPGISDHLIERMFFPFVTTRGPDRGRGLGLSVTYGIVRSHGGAIAVSSSPGEGALVSLLLPLSGPRRRS